MALLVIFTIVLGVVSASSGANCPSTEPPLKQIICYYEGSTPLAEVNLCNCTHLIFTNISNVEDYNLTFQEDVNILQQTALDSKDLKIIFTLNLKPEQTAAIIKSDGKKDHLISAISDFLRNSKFSGVELNLQFQPEDGSRKEKLVAFVKDLKNALDHHRSKRDGYSVIEEHSDDITTRRYLNDKNEKATKKGINKKKKARISREDKNVDFYDEDDGELSVVEEYFDGEPSLKRTKRRKENEQEGGGYLILLRLSITPEIIAKKYDLKALSKYVDYLTVPTHMITDESEENVTFHPSRLMGLSDILNTDSILDLLTGLGAPKSRIIISMPASVLKYQLKDSKRNTARSPTVGHPEVITQSKMCSLLKGSDWTVERDEDLTAPYAFSKSTWLAFEDEISINIKGKYILLRELAGGAIYPIDADTSSDACAQQNGGRIAGALQANFGGLARKPRQVVLESLQEQIHDTAFYSQEAGVHLSEYRIVRVVDHEGAVHVIRKNTKTEFECSRQGYFSHPLGCNKFYRCVKFNQYSDDYTVFEYDCPAGLAFDERWEVCVWPGSLPHGAPCTGSSEIAPVPRSHYACPNAEGYYADPENCRWFFACIDHSRDGISPLTAYEFRCPFGLVFDEERLACEWPWLVGGCGARGATGYVVAKAGGSSSYLGTASIATGGSYIAGQLQDNGDRASFATIPDYIISGGRIANKEAGVILNQNVAGIPGIALAGKTKVVGSSGYSGQGANFGLAGGLDGVGYYQTPTPSSLLVEDGGSSHRQNIVHAVHVNTPRPIVYNQPILSQEISSVKAAQGSVLVNNLQPAIQLGVPGTVHVEQGSSLKKTSGQVFVTPQPAVAYESAGINFGHREAGLTGLQGSHLKPNYQDEYFGRYGEKAAFASTISGADLGGYVYDKPAIQLELPVAGGYGKKVTTVGAREGYVYNKPALQLELPTRNLYKQQNVAVATGYKYQQPALAVDIISPGTITAAQPILYENKNILQQQIKTTAPIQTVSQNAHPIVYQHQQDLTVVTAKPVHQEVVNVVHPTVEQVEIAQPVVYQQPAVTLKPTFYQKEIITPRPVIYQQRYQTPKPIVIQQEIVKPKPIIYQQELSPIVTPKPVIYQQQLSPIVTPKPIHYTQTVVTSQPFVHEQRVISENPVFYNQEIAVQKPAVQFEQVVAQPIVTAKPIAYGPQLAVTPATIVFGQKQSFVTPKPVVYTQQVVTPRPVVYEQKQTYVTPKPVVYQQEVLQPVVTPKPVVYTQQVVTPRPVVYEQKQTYVTPRPVVYQQEVVQPVVTPKPVVYTQQVITPRPVVYEQKQTYVTPRPVIYQQEVVQPVVTPKPVVYTQQVVTPRPVVYEQKRTYVTPRPVVYQQEVVQPVVTPKPVVYTQQVVTPRPVVYEQKQTYVTPRPVVYQQEVVQPVVTPKPVVYTQQVVTPRPAVYEQKQTYVTPRPVVYQQEVVQPIVTPKPVVYTQQVVTPRPVVYEQKQTYVTPRPVVYQQEVVQPIVTPKPVVYTQEVVTPRPVVYEQKQTYVTPRPVVYQQEVVQPVVTPKPVVYTQQVVTPRPVVYEQKQTYVTPRPVVYQQEVVQPVVTPKPVVYTQEVVTPRPVVYQQELIQPVATPKQVIHHQEYIQPAVTPVVAPKPAIYRQQVIKPVAVSKPVYYQKQVVQPVVTPSPVLSQKQFITPEPKPVVYQQEIIQPVVTPKPAVYQQEIVQPIVTPEPVIYKRPVVAPKSIYQEQYVRPVVRQRPSVYQEQIVTPAKTVVYQQDIVTPQTIVYKQPIVTQRPVTYQQQYLQPVVTQKPVVYKQEVIAPQVNYQRRPPTTPKAVLYQQVFNIKTPEPVTPTIYSEVEPVSTPKPVIYQQPIVSKQVLSTAKPIVVQEQTGGYIYDRPVGYQQEIIKTKPTLEVYHNQEILAVTQKPVVLTQKVQPVSYPKQIFYEQQSFVTPKPIVAHDVTPSTIFYQENYEIPRVTIRQKAKSVTPIVYQETPKVLVSQQRKNIALVQTTPRPSFFSTKIVQPISPIVTQQETIQVQPDVEYHTPLIVQEPKLRLRGKIQTTPRTVYSESFEANPGIAVLQKELIQPIQAVTTQAPIVLKGILRQKEFQAQEYLPPVTEGNIVTLANLDLQRVKQIDATSISPLEELYTPGIQQGVNLGFNENIEVSTPEQYLVDVQSTTAAPESTTRYTVRPRTRVRVRPVTTTTEASREYLPPAGAIAPTSRRGKGRGKATIVSIGQVDKEEVDDQNIEVLIDKYSGKYGDLSEQDKERFVTKVIKGEGKGTIKVGKEPEVSTVGYEITSSRSRARGRGGSRKFSSTSTTTEGYYEETGVSSSTSEPEDDNKDTDTADISLATLDLKNLKVKKDKKTVIVVSQVSDANPILIGKLAGQCSCQSNKLDIRKGGNRSSGRGGRGRDQSQRDNDDGDDDNSQNGDDGDEQSYAEPGRDGIDNGSGYPGSRSENRSGPKGRGRGKAARIDDENGYNYDSDGVPRPSARGRPTTPRRQKTNGNGLPTAENELNLDSSIDGQAGRPNNDEVRIFGNNEPNDLGETAQPGDEADAAILIGSYGGRAGNPRGRQPVYTDNVAIEDGPGGSGEINVEIYNDQGVRVPVTSTTTIIPEVSPSILLPIAPSSRRKQIVVEPTQLPDRPSGRRIPSRSKAKKLFVPETTSPLFSPIPADEIASTVDYANVHSGESGNDIPNGSTGEPSRKIAGAAFDRYGPGGWRGADETLQGSVDCKRPGLFRHPKYCNKFYACNYDPWKKRYTLHVFNCPVHLAYDSNIGACNWPSKGPACADDNLLV